MRLIAILLLLVSFFLVEFCSAEDIILKSGKKIQGTIIDKTEKYINVEISGVVLPYFFDDIESIDGIKSVTMKKEQDTLSFEKSLIQECINNSKIVSCYHSEMFIRDLNDPRVKNSDVHSVDFIIDYVKPDRISVEQYAAVEKVADKWITINNATFRYFNFWIKMSFEEEMQHGVFRLNEYLLLDKYIDVLANNNPESTKDDLNLFSATYYLNNWDVIGRFWKLKDYRCVITISINKELKLIEKAYFKITGKAGSGNDINSECGQIFSAYDKNITIDVPEALDFDKDKEKILKKVKKMAK